MNNPGSPWKDDPEGDEEEEEQEEQDPNGEFRESKLVEVSEAFRGRSEDLEMEMKKRSEFEAEVWNATSSGNIDQLRDVLQTSQYHIDSPNPFDDNRTLMHQAAIKGDAMAIELFVRLGSIRAGDTLGSGPLHLAAQFGQCKAIETLFRFGGRGTQSSWYLGGALLTAVTHDKFEAVDTLLRLGASLDGFPMHETAKRRTIYCRKTIETLYQLGYSVDARDKRNQTPLHCAASFLNLEAIESLVRLGSQSINTPCNRGWEPIRYAMDTYSERTALVLKALGASDAIAVQNMDKGGMRVLHAPMNDADVLDIRYRVYFECSLVRRLLLELREGRPLAQ